MLLCCLLRHVLCRLCLCRLRCLCLCLSLRLGLCLCCLCLCLCLCLRLSLRLRLHLCLRVDGRLLLLWWRVLCKGKGSEGEQVVAFEPNVGRVYAHGAQGAA